MKRMNIRVSARRGVSVTLPYFVSFDEAMRFFISKREWVLKTMKRQESIAPVTELTAAELAELRREAAEYLPGRLAEYASRYGFKYSSLRLKHNKTNWGSCSSKGNINLNISLMRVPSLLRDYVILHELCHLRHPNHGEGFHQLLETLCTELVSITAESGDGLAKEVSAEVATSISGRRKPSFPIEKALARRLRKYRP
ncbi:MAG: M48 family metallopeptidase [Candidatus Cryptobacteroides sp.]